MVNLKRLNFSYKISHFVHGLVDPDEAYEQFYEGTISQVKLPKHPKTIGMFELYVYDIRKAKMFDEYDNMLEIIKDLSLEVILVSQIFIKLWMITILILKIKKEFYS